MKALNLWNCTMMGALILIIATCSFAQDWPQWRGDNRDGKVTGFNAPQAWPAALKQVWKVTVGVGDSTPALVGDRLYVFTRQGEDEVTLCLDAKTGTEAWRDKYAAQPVAGPASRHPGPRSSPAVADGKVVTLGVAGVLSCLDAAKGAPVWRKDPFPGVVPEFFSAMSPIIVDGMALAHLGGPGNGAFIAFDLNTGDEKWRWGGEGPEYASPVLLTVAGTRQVVTLTEKSVVGIGVADGALLWQLPFVPARRAYNAATPLVDGQTVIYMGAGRGSKAVKVEKQGDGFSATELWSNPDIAPQFSTPVLKDGFIFGLSNTGNLFCLNEQTGQTAWVDGTVRDKGGFSAIIDAGSVILALPSSSEMVVFEPSGTAYAELARVKAADTPTYAHPVLAGSTVFVKDEATLAMCTIE